MGSCPTCHKEWEGDLSHCPVCGEDMETEAEERWLMIGTIEDKLSADFAREALASYDIPAVIISRSGFFGNIGLTLNPFYNSRSEATFTVSVPTEFVEEAKGVLEMTVGKAWHPKEESDND